MNLVPSAKSIPPTDTKPIQSANPKPRLSSQKLQKSFSKPAQLPPRNEKQSQNEPSSISKQIVDFSSIEKSTKNPNTNTSPNTNTNIKNQKSKTGLHVHEDEQYVKRKQSNVKSKQKKQSQSQERESSRENSLPVSAPLPPAPPPTHVTNISSAGEPPDPDDPDLDLDIPSSSINEPDSSSFSSNKRESGAGNNYSSDRNRQNSQDKEKEKESTKTTENNLVSILNTTFKDQAKKVVIKAEEGDDCKADETEEYEDAVEEEMEQIINVATTDDDNADDDEFFGEDDFDLGAEWDGEGWTDSFRQNRNRNLKRQKMKTKAQKKSSAVQVPTNQEQLAHDEEIYNGMQIKTFGDLLEAKARRPRRLDAYCLGRGLMEPRLDIVEPQIVSKSSIKEYQLEGYQQFLDKIRQIEEENTQNEQIICVFTADLVRRNKKTWSEDCNLIEAAVVFLCRYLEPSGYLLWVRTGSQKGWKDPESPFITDRHIVLKSLPTIKIWNTEKRLGGTRVFTLDNITVMLED